ncbi:MAG: prefoldin subunit beta [Thermoprotei archaeon]|nr:MAG: prefoldin subunit beta [Thermoprotei archaeon]RLF17636.1 MAG: prefoldin subunit beta [Thermoprotei archaeon]
MEAQVVMSQELPPELQHKIMQLQESQERLRALILRRQQYEVELREVQRALEELEKLSPETPIYKSVGTLLFLADRDKTIAELQDKKETLELHIKTLERQENLARKQVEELRQKITQSLSSTGAGGA